MDKRRSIYLAAGFGALLLVVMLLLAWGGRRQSQGIVLPESQGDSAGMDGSSGESRLNVVAITPETVRPAISTLSRPASYTQSQTVETFWSGGKGESTSTVAVSGPRTRVDTTEPGGTRHMLVQDGTAAVWYDEETEWTVLRSEDYSADTAARMPTYETVLALPVSAILEADYRDREGTGCIYVATVESASGYADRYWVSVSTGLLTAAERTWNGELVYRFTASDLSTDPPEDSLFLLPDGSVLE